MQTYAAIDLHSNNGAGTVIDETDRVLRQRKLPNKLQLFVDELEPFRDTLQGVAVESTFNWYWLVDGLRDEFHVRECHARCRRRTRCGSASGGTLVGAYEEVPCGADRSLVSTSQPYLHPHRRPEFSQGAFLRPIELSGTRGE